MRLLFLFTIRSPRKIGAASSAQLGALIVSLFLVLRYKGGRRWSHAMPPLSEEPRQQ